MDFALTKEFIEKLVNQPITDFEVSAGSKAGDNVASDLKAIKVSTAPGDIISLVHKTFPLNDPMSTAFVIESKTFRIENEFYATLVPILEDLLKSRHIPNYRLPVPQFFAGFNDDAHDYVTLQDLRPAGYIMPDKFKGLTLPETKLILQQLARFHAATYFLIKHEGEKFFETHPLLNVGRAFGAPEKQAELGLMMAGIVRYMIENVSKRNPDLGQRLAAKFADPDTQKAMSRTMLSTDSLYFPVIVHGDIWMNNTLFKYDEGGQPVDVKFIDFQRVKRGNIFEDLQYFLWTSTTPEFRRQHLYEVLDVYYSSFSATLTEIRCPLPLGFSRGTFIDSFDDCRLGAYVFMGFAVPLQLGENPRMPFDSEESDRAAGVSGGNGNEGEQQPPPPFNVNDIPLEVRVQAFVGNLRSQLEGSPRALDRLQDLTEELAALKLL